MSNRKYQPTKLISTVEAAEMIGISKRKLQQIAAGESCLDKRQVTGTRRVGFTLESVLEFLGDMPDAKSKKSRDALRPQCVRQS